MDYHRYKYGSQRIPIAKVEGQSTAELGGRKGKGETKGFQNRRQIRVTIEEGEPEQSNFISTDIISVFIY